MRNFIKAGIAPLFGTAVLMSAPVAIAAGECLVASDSGTDSFNPTFDITSLSAGTTDNVLTSVVEFSTPPDGAAGSSVRVIYNERRYMEADLSVPGFALFEYGTYTDNGDGTVNFTADGEAQGSVDGNTVSISVAVAAFGLTGIVTASAETAAPFITGLDTTDAGLYTIGDSCANKLDYVGVHYTANQALKNSTVTQTAGAGSLGWLLLSLAGLGLRRRR